MKKRTIAVDIDDVLATSVKSWIAHSNATWGTNLTVDDYDEDWAKMWGVSRVEGRQRALDIYKAGVVLSFDRFKEADYVLKQLSKHYKLVITTSRVEHTRDDTLAWLDEHFRGVFEEIHLAGFYESFKLEALTMTKAELCKQIGADFLIDDHPKHCFAAAEAGIESILFGDYSWNREIKKLPKHVTRCKDWSAVLEYFDGRS